MSPIPDTSQSKYTYEDYRHLPDNLRCEIIEGQVYDMTPAPSLRHQEIAGKIYRLIGNHIERVNHPCRVYISPADVILSPEDVVQPDVFIVCKQTKIHKEGLFGAPDVIIEVLSLSTAKKDRTKKMRLYRKFGVLEYFLVDPDEEYIEKYEFPQGWTRLIETYEGDATFSIDTIGLDPAAKDLFA